MCCFFFFFFFLFLFHLGTDRNLRFESKLVIFHKSQFMPRGYKTFFVLNSVEHEILNAHKYIKYQEIRPF